MAAYRGIGEVVGREATNARARELLAKNESELERLVPQLVELVAAEVGLPPVPLGHKWPVDIVEVTREFLTAIAVGDLARIREPGSMFEVLGTESARGGVPFKTLARAIRVSNRRIQAQVHRAVLDAGDFGDTESTLELLARVVTAGEAVVAAALEGYKRAALGNDDDEAIRRVATALIYGNGQTAELADAMGWASDISVCVIVAPPEDAADIRQASRLVIPYYAHGDEVVLIHPVGQEKLATSLRALLADATCVVGPAVPLTEVPSSLSLARRLSALKGATSGALFADDHLLELACSADPSVVAALRRKYFVDLDALPSAQRALLVDTLRQWLLQWGHRPGIAEALDVHPQTVSGRINRLKDLLADDLEDPTVRSELLVLLTVEGIV